MRQTVIAALIMTSALLAAQQTPTFEVASVKPAPPPSDHMMRVRMGGDPGRIDYANVSLLNLITRAYDVKDYQVSGPGWLNSERYDVTATMPKDTPKEIVQLMMQNLLSERFHLKLHREKKDLPAYALVVAKGGPKMKQAETPAAAAPAKRGIWMGMGKLQASSVDLGMFANLLSNLVGRPVLDMTEMKGNYDCTLEFTPDASLSMPMMKMAGAHAEGGEGAPPESAGPSIFTALQEQLGLKLEARKAPLDILVIDQAEKVPTEN